MKDNNHALTREAAAHQLASPLRMVPILLQLQTEIHRRMIKNPEIWSAPKNDSKTGKEFLPIDEFAEKRFIADITKILKPHVIVDGEENLRNRKLNFRSSKSLHILCDMVDGTDLLVRDFSNWCSAFVAFDPDEKSIISSYVYLVGHRADKLYIANREFPHVRMQPFIDVFVNDLGSGRSIKERVGDLKIISSQKRRNIGDATICSYAQKMKNQFVLSEFFIRVKKSISESEFTSARYYNLAGNPMICRILDGTVDLVFDIAGQHPHDVVPGAFIALKGGAAMRDLRKVPLRGSRVLEITDLLEFLYEPNAPKNQMKYVIASHDQLANEFVELCIRSKNL